jgi:ABC-type transport system involved in cytochrome c biogenesis permease subunit
LKNSIEPEGATDFAGVVADYKAALAPGMAAFQAQEKKEIADPKALENFARFVQAFRTMEKFAYPLAIPPLNPEPNRNAWVNMGAGLLGSIETGEIHPAVAYFARMAGAYGSDNAMEFNSAVAGYKNWLAQNFYKELAKGRAEFYFNDVKMFLHATIIYIFAFLLAGGALLTFGTFPNLSESFRRSAFYLIALAFVVHTFALVFRMVLDGRPPVTNLYSSAIFIGWGAVIVALILERIFRDGIGAACAGAIGFVTLVIAHHLAGSGDTLEMLQAVLDTNIWLATHVVAITTGYSAMFLAGMLAMIYIVRGVFTRSLTKQTADSLARMTYGVVCFATLFSFVGTVLGGIWADQSWGRFWGWDPKENGAVLIVLWCAIILHARWGGFIRQRGLMIMAIFGNVVTSFSWFGVNMLGVGLHSYGFMQKAFPWLVGFMLSQFALMCVAAMPLERWRSFRPASSPSPARPRISPAPSIG